MIERCAIRVLSSAQRRARSLSPSATRCQMRRVLEQVDQRPAQRGHQVRHRRDVDQRDVERDAARCGRRAAPPTRPRRSGRTGLVGRLAGIRALHRGCDELRRCRRAPPARRACPTPRPRPSRRGARRRRSRRGCRRPHQAIEGVALRRSRSRPRRQSHPVPEPAGEVEHVDGAVGSRARRQSARARGRDCPDTKRRRRGGTTNSAAFACRRRSRREACAATSDSRRRPCSRCPRAARRTTRRRRART